MADFYFTGEGERCPFCGGSSLEIRTSGPHEAPPFWVECGKCGAGGPPADHQTDAIENWNDRFSAPVEGPQGQTAARTCPAGSAEGGAEGISREDAAADAAARSKGI